MWVEKTIVDIMKNIPEHYGDKTVSSSYLQFHDRAKFLRNQLRRRTHAYRHHAVQRGDAVSVVRDLDKFLGKDDAFLFSSCEGNVVCKYFLVIAIMGNMTLDTVWVIRIELDREAKHFTCTDGRMV